MSSLMRIFMYYNRLLVIRPSFFILYLKAQIRDLEIGIEIFCCESAKLEPLRYLEIVS